MKRTIFILLFIFPYLNSFGQERQFQLRNINNVEVQFSKITSLSFTQRNYYIPKTSSMEMGFFGDVAGEFDITRWLEVGAAGRMMGTRKDANWYIEQRPMVYGTLSAYLGKLEFDFFNRFEYRILKDEDDQLRHRQRVTLEMPPFNFSWLTLFASEEGFYLFGNERFNKLRLSAGSKVVYKKNFEMKIYYMFERKKILPVWASSDILGFNLSMDF